MKSYAYFATFAFFVMATASHADGHNIPSKLAWQCNTSGAEMTTESGDTFYLGQSCDAAQKNGGTGSWWWAASGIIVEINGQSIRYNNEIPCDITYCLPPN